MNEIKIFENSEFGEIRTVEVNDEPWFCLTDICKALELTQPSKVAERLKAKGVNTIPTLTAGGTQNLLYINESNLYRAITQSRKESAERFTDWVTEEVLPSIRKTGEYKIQVPTSPLEQIKVIAQGFTELYEKVDSLNDDLQGFKQEMPVLALDCERITRAKSQRVVHLMGGKYSEAYCDKSLRTRVYKDLEAQIRREFGIDTYKAIKRNQVDKAIEIIRLYELLMVLSEEIKYANAQMSMSV